MPEDTQLDVIPKHVAIIMDGNGRWAEGRSLPRTSGHMEGVRRVEEILETASTMGVKVLTLFTFSTENWNRPKTEIMILMRTVSDVLKGRIGKLNQLNVRFQMIGVREGTPEQVLKAVEMTRDATKNNTGMILNMAFNYGGRKEIIDGVKDIAQRVKDGRLNIEDITDQTLSDTLYTAGLPDPDLLVRTSGEQRISNFLLWQCSYAEFYFTEKYWPDFTSDEFKKAILAFQNRERRYGNV